MPIQFHSTLSAEQDAFRPAGAAALPPEAMAGSHRASLRQLIVWGVFAAFLLGLAVAIRMRLLLDVSFSYDEACSWRISQFRWHELWDAISRDAHPPLFYLLQRSWQSLFGTSIAAARALSLLGGMLAIVLAFWLATVLAGSLPASNRPTRRKIFFAAAVGVMVAFHPYLVQLSQTARPYLWAVCLTLLASGFLFRAIQTPQRARNWTGFCVAASALSLTHYYGLLSVASLFLFALVESGLRMKSEGITHEGRARLAGLTLSAGVIQLFWWPWGETFGQQLQRAGEQFWLPPLNYSSWANVCARSLSGLETLSPIVIMGLAPLWLIVPTLLLLQRNPASRLLAFTSAGPLLMATASAVLFRNMLEPRYLVLALAPLLIGIIWLLATIRSPFWQYSTIGLVSFGLVLCCFKSLSHREQLAASPGLQQAATYLNQHRKEGESLLISSPFLMVCLQPLLNEPEQIGVRFDGNHRRDVLAGPPIRVEEIARYESVLKARPPRLWTVDAEKILGKSTDVAVPWDYRPTSQKRFFEASGFDMEFVVRSYELTASHDPQPTSRN